MIFLIKIDRHSLTCFKVSDSVFKIETNVSIKQIDYKLEKLKETLTFQMNQTVSCNIYD